MQFTVKWEDYDESYNTEEPWKNLQHTEKLHQYLREKGYEKLIPK